MVATQTASDNIAFYVCNNPGPEGRSQEEVDQVIEFGVASERRVACVAMEWSVTPGVNGGQPFTKFLTFGPDGTLIQSVNLDGRGEKFMPGACIACHGGARLGARFPMSGNPSPLLGARFLPFDTGNFLFSTRGGLTEASQGAAFRELNRLVASTEGPSATATTRLVDGWYRAGGNELDKSFVPGDPATTTGWRETPEKAAFYREVIGTSCRTCHTALGPFFDWDSKFDRFNRNDPTVQRHVCGGQADLMTNASMPNALASLNRLLVDHPPGSALRQRMNDYLGCTAPAEDPVYPRR
jgi:mono/diheme cytochrome c family protein